jgi:hypothetical protein
MGINENTFWAANGESSASSYRLLKGLDLLMKGATQEYDFTDGRNVGLKRLQNVDCSPEKYKGFADYGDRFGPNDKNNFIASIEIPMDVLCKEGSSEDPIYYAIYRQVNIFVPNSTDESSKQHHLISGFQMLETESGKTFDPEKEKPKTDRCAIGLYQNHNIVLTATIINKNVSQPQSKTMAVLKYRKSKVDLFYRMLNFRFRSRKVCTENLRFRGGIITNGPQI